MLDKHKVMALLNEPVNGMKITTTSLTSGATSTSNNAYAGTITSTANGATNALYVYPSTSTGNITTWDYWQHHYYPLVIRESYPVYLQERAMDKGHKAFEVLKALQDKKLVKFDKVSDFIDAMDVLIKVI